jgi:hypothetical protein
MKRLTFAGLLALGLAFAARPALADCRFEYSCSRHFYYEHTSKQRSFCFSSHSNPLSCSTGYCGYHGPAMWDGYNAYAHSYAAPDGAPADGTKSPDFKAPQPTPNPKGGASTAGLQQAAYYYYAPAAYTGYGYGYGYYQAPSYWYGD